MKSHPENNRYVIGIGSQKCGTSTIARFLMNNGVVYPRRKELHAFHSERFTSRNEYLHLLGVKPKSGLTYGEFTPNTIYQPTALWNLSRILPEALVIVSMRDPVERAFSAYHHAAGIGFVKQHESFEDIIYQSLRGSTRNWVKDILNMGLYGPQVRRLLELFPANQILFIDFDSIVSDEGSVRSAVAKFANIPINESKFAITNQRSIYSRRQSAETMEIPESIRIFLRSYYFDSDNELKKLIPIKMGWHQE